jgi:hypothetical protein
VGQQFIGVDVLVVDPGVVVFHESLETQQVLMSPVLELVVEDGLDL